jgi:hypothetical protein
MARKEKQITISAEGRDKGKLFFIRELPARAAEKWASKVLFALMNAGVQVPDNIRSFGLAALVGIGISALGKIPFEAAEPLLEEMMGCVTYHPDPNNKDISRPYERFVESDIEEVATIILLRKEIIKLHTDFFMNASR